MVAFKRAVLVKVSGGQYQSMVCSTTESVKGSSLSFQSIHNIHSSHSLSFCMFSVCNSILYDIFKENLEHSTSFFIDKPRDTFDTTSASQTKNAGFVMPWMLSLRIFLCFLAPPFPSPLPPLPRPDMMKSFALCEIVHTVMIHTEYFSLEKARGFNSFTENLRTFADKGNTYARQKICYVSFIS